MNEYIYIYSTIYIYIYIYVYSALKTQQLKGDQRRQDASDPAMNQGLVMKAWDGPLKTL